ncbi:DUF3618 domain-containing protein [Actinoplanes siamensis]|uniref:DUF3618 domain-containing protein n=1 Tax=Actinoplanes siamensis TaxID=1223317 RepID=A0A919N378_9ACTN|nr:DUF3618 domain-containing protein [Actinoplanes siamensis]GIF03541.1 hypothetical protein Asi03nite_10790 [Actinoplanes siamensis]
MSESNGTAGKPDNGTAGKPDLVALRAEIKQTRADLGETVQALAAKADVKARAREQVSQTKQRLLDQAVSATGRLREVAGQASATVRDAAGQASATVKDAAGQASSTVKDAAGQTAAVSGDVAHDAVDRVRSGRIPPALIVAGLAAVVGVILILRGRRR